MSNRNRALKKARRHASRANRWQWQVLRRRLWRVGRLSPDVALPRCFDEKFLWRKVFDHDPRFVIACDKLATKAYVKARWPDVAVARTLWTGRRGRDLPAELCRSGTVLKYNAGSGTNLVLAGSERPEDMAAMLNGWMRLDYGWDKGEWAYGPVRRRVFAEQAVFGDAPVSEIKVYVQGGHVDQVVMIYTDTGQKTAAIWEADASGALTLAGRRAAVSPVRDTRDLPAVVARALDISTRIGAEFDHMRLDFMTDLSDLVLGELTVYNLSGRMAAIGLDGDARANRHWDLRRSWFANQNHAGWLGDYAAQLRADMALRAERDPVAARVPAIDPGVFDISYDDFAPN